jgi:Major tropism determinant N-terminal domain
MAYKKILFRRDTSANWGTTNPVLAGGEIGLETNTNKIKIGNGSTAWNQLPYFYGSLEAANLNDISDVTITSAQNGDVLRWNGTAWVNDPINLGTDTVGSYVESLVAGTGVTLSNNSGEGATPTVAIGQAVGTSSSVTFAAVTAPVIGNASTASTLQTARTIEVSGDVSGSASFDGSQNINITTAVQPNSVALGTDTTGDYVSSLVAGTGVTLSNNSGESATPTIAIGQAVGTSSSVTFAHVLGDVTGNVTGNSSTASALQTPRTISLLGDVSGSVSFDGSSNASITTAIQPNSIALGTDTTGNYMAGVTGGTGVTVTHTPGEGSDATISIGQAIGTEDTVTFHGANIGNIRVGVTDDNTIDTSSGNLTIDSSGGTTTINDNLIVTGGLTVSGSVTVVSTTNLQVDDSIITLNHEEVGTPSQNAGIEVERGTSDNVFLIYNEATDKWQLTNDGTTYSPIETTSTVTTKIKQQLWLNDVYAATVTALPNSPTYTAGTSDMNGGTGVGAKLTATTNGELSIDGAPAALNYRVLVKNQANNLHNGIYKVTAAGSPSTTWELTRSADFDNSTFGQATYGKSVRAATGDVNQLQSFALSSFGTVYLDELEEMVHVIGSDPITWTQISGKAVLIPGNGLEITNNVLALPSIGQSNTASTSGASNFVQNVNIDSYGRVLGVTTNDVQISLGTNTSGDYVQSVSASAGSGLTVSGTGESATVTIGSNATSSNTASAIVMRDSSGNFSAGNITAELTGNASTANTLYTTRSIGLTGDLSGSVSFDGSQDVVINAQYVANSVALGADTSGDYVASLVAGTGVTLTNNSGESASPQVSIGQDVATSASVTFAKVTAPLTGNVTGNVTGNLTGNVNGNVTGNVTGSVDGSISGNAATVSSIGNHGIDALSDVTAPSPSSGDFLKWNGSAWINDPIDLGTDTSGNFVASINAGTGVSLTNGVAQEAGTPTINIGQAVGTTNSPSFANLYLGNAQVDAQQITYSSGTGLATVTAVGHGLTVGARITVVGATQTGYNGTYSITSVPNSTTFTYQPVTGPSANIASGPFLVYVAGALTFEGSTDDSFETTIVAVDPTADRIISLPDATTQLVGRDTTDTLTNKTLTSPTITGVSPVLTLSGDLSGSATFTDLGNATLTASIAANSVALGTDTTGSYVESLVQGTGVTITNNAGEGATPTIAIGQNVSTNACVVFDTLTVTNLYATNQQSSSQSTLNVSDNKIVLNDGTTGAPTQNGAIVIDRGSSSSVEIRWNETEDRWEATADGSTYTQIAAGAKMTISDSPPASPQNGDFWFESDSAITFVYYDSYWIEIGASGIGAVTSSAAPSNPANGQIWFKSTTNEMYVYYNGSWVLVNSATSTSDVEIASIMGVF